MRFILLIFILASCGPGVHLRLAKKHLRIAKMKGAVITPDTVYKLMPVFVKGQNIIVKADPVLDSSLFEFYMTKYDSVMKVTSTLVSKAELIKANQEIKTLKKRLIRGFAKDSTYVFTMDSVNTVFINMKNGTPDSVHLVRLPTVVKHNIPIAVDNKIESKCWPWWWLLVAGFSSFGIGVLVGILKR